MSERFEGMAAIAQEEALHRLERAVDSGTDADKEAAWKEVYRQQKDRLVSIAQGIVQRSEVAEEIVQETLLRAVEHFGEFERQGNFSSWLAVIAKNLALDYVRRKSQKSTSSYEDLRRSGFDPADSAHRNPEAALRQKEVSVELRVALEKIGQRYRKAIELRDFEEKTREEAAAAMDVTVGNFDVIHTRAKQALKKVLEDSEIVDLAA